MTVERPAHLASAASAAIAMPRMTKVLLVKGLVRGEHGLGDPGGEVAAGRRRPGLDQQRAPLRNIVTSGGDDEARNFGRDAVDDHEARYERAAEFVEVATALWDSWATCACAT